jgi:hypothetical protein
MRAPRADSEKVAKVLPLTMAYVTRLFTLLRSRSVARTVSAVVPIRLVATDGSVRLSV